MSVAMTFPVHVAHADTKRRRKAAGGLRAICWGYAEASGVGSLSTQWPPVIDGTGETFRVTVTDRDEKMAKAVAAELRYRLNFLDGHKDALHCEVKAGPAMFAAGDGGFLL